MITKKDCLEYLLKIEPGFNQKLDEHLKKWGGQSNLHSQMTEFSIFIEHKLSLGEYTNAPTLFRGIEFLLTEQNANEEVKNALCTCFLENLINYFSDRPEKFDSFIPLLGSKSREYCKSWDEFTGVQTPGLWGNEKPNFRSRPLMVADTEALALIKAIKNHEFKTASEEEEKIRFLEVAFPGISNLIFYDRRNLTAEQILLETKKQQKG